MKLENITDLISCKESDISEKNKKVCIFGQGFVGLPLALSLALRGCETIGVDINKNLVNDTNNGITYHTENYNGITIQEILKEELKEKRYKATIDGASAVRECKNIIVTVGIPIKDGKYIMDYLEKVCITIGKNLKKEDLIKRPLLLLYQISLFMKDATTKAYINTLEKNMQFTDKFLNQQDR